MIKNYLTASLRNMKRNPVFTWINIAGLSVGLASSMLILLWIVDETSFDRFHHNYRNIYQVMMNSEASGTVLTQSTLPYPLHETLAASSSNITSVVVTADRAKEMVLSVGELSVNKSGLAVSSNFANMFSFRPASGDMNTALDEVGSIVLTASSAKALYGDRDPIGQMLTVDHKFEAKVTAVIDDVPAQSSITFDFLVPFEFLVQKEPWIRETLTDWNNFPFRLYVAASDDRSMNEMNQSIKDLVARNNNDVKGSRLFLHPMSKWRLYSNFENGEISGGMIEYVYLFASISIVVLIMACINFTNLATARSESRAKEIGVRKSIGSGKSQLIAQFLCESIMIALIAFVICVVLVEAALPAYNSLVEKKLFVDYGSRAFWIVATGIICITGLLSGIYPAVVLSNMKTVSIIKGRAKGGKNGLSFRSVLVVAQYATSLFLIVGAIVIYQQIDYTKTRNIGYNKSNLLSIRSTAAVEQNFASFKEELKQTGVVKSVAKSNSPITGIYANTILIDWPGKNPDEVVSFTTVGTEYDYIETNGVKLLDGRDFSREFPSDSSAVIINRSALDVMNLESPVGTRIRLWGREWTIVGVMENVVMGSPFQPVGPMVLVFAPGWSGNISIRLDPNSSPSDAIANVQSVFKKFDNEQGFSFHFADEEFERKFVNVTLTSRLAEIFTGLSMVISGLGIFGLAAFMTQQRTKEVGLRKVLGSSVLQIILLFAKDFVWLVAIAFVISAPVSWWASNSFLERYAYRITVDWWIFPVAGLASLLVSVLIVGTQAIRAARINPAQSLRSE